MNKDEEFAAVTTAAERILDIYGRPETSDSARVIFTEGDLNIAREAGVIEIVFRGSLVFRSAPDEAAGGQIFEEHGVWRAAVARRAQALPISNQSEKERSA